MMKTLVAVIGGSFDPPTIAHALMAAELLNQKIVNKVVYVPCGTREDKPLQDASHRVKMLELTIKDFFPDNAPIEINLIEVKNGPLIPTYTLLQYMTKESNDHIYFVLGSDLLKVLSKDLVKWDCGEKLIEEFNFIVLQRSGIQIQQDLLPINSLKVDEFAIGTSSTQVRKRIRDNQTCPNRGILGLVSKSVIQYITDLKLYE